MIGIDNVAVGEMLGLYGFNTRLLCNTVEVRSSDLGFKAQDGAVAAEIGLRLLQEEPGRRQRRSC